MFARRLIPLVGRSQTYGVLLDHQSASNVMGQFLATTAGTYALYFEGTGKIKLSGTATGTYSPGQHTITTTAGTLHLLPVGDDMMDADGNVYPTVIIGQQTWMAANLNVGVYVESTNTGVDHSDCSNNGIIQKYACANNQANLATYGGLYDWDEMMGYTETEGAQGIAPAGWHIPTDTEWKTLEMALGMTQAQADVADGRGTDQGTKLKEGGTSGFNAPLSGYRYTNGAFGLLGYATYFWSSSASSGSAWRRYLYSGYSGVVRYADSKLYGFSVRAIKDTSQTVTPVVLRRLS